MLNRFARAAFTRLITPAARALLAWGVSPDAVTVVGTLGVVLGALVLYPAGHLLAGTLVITLFVFSDMLDGTMARLSGRSSAWGAFLDSTLDRVGDAAVFGGLVLYAAARPDDVGPAFAGLALACLVLGSVVSYARARAEGLGMTAAVGIAERADRLVVVLVATAATGLFHLPSVVLEVVLAALAVASAVTVVQRIATVHRQCRDGAGAPAAAPAAPGPSAGPSEPPSVTDVGTGRASSTSER